MRHRHTWGRWLLGALAVSAVLTAGCTRPVDPDDLPGTYHNEETDGRIVLETDGTFIATHIAMSGDERDAADFSGEWDFVDSDTTDDFVYLAVKDGGLGMTGGVQLYTGGEGELYFRVDPDDAPSLVLTTTTAT
jgi:hypothetical protein